MNLHEAIEQLNNIYSQQSNRLTEGIPTMHDLVSQAKEICNLVVPIARRYSATDFYFPTNRRLVIEFIVPEENTEAAANAVKEKLGDKYPLFSMSSDYGDIYIANIDDEINVNVTKSEYEPAGDIDYSDPNSYVDEWFVRLTLKAESGPLKDIPVEIDVPVRTPAKSISTHVYDTNILWDDALFSFYTDANSSLPSYIEDMCYIRQTYHLLNSNDDLINLFKSYDRSIININGDHCSENRNLYGALEKEDIFKTLEPCTIGELDLLN